MNKTALVVDDSKSARFALRKFLEGFNYTVTTADSANDAYKQLGGALPDVIFLDHIMPGVDGFEALRVIRTDSRSAAVPVVICSSNEGEDFAAQALARGASDVLQKPPSAEQIAGVLANLVGRSQDQPLPAAAGAEAAPAAAPLTRREPTAMERLMATIPPKMIPTAHLLAQDLDSPAAAPPLQAAVARSLPNVPDPPASPKVQPIREPAVAIQQAVMKSLRGALPSNNEPRSYAQAPALPAMPAFSGGDTEPVAGAALRREIDSRFGKMTEELFGEIAQLRAQLSNLASSVSEDKIRNIAQEAAKTRSNALAQSLEHHLAALRNNLDAVLRAQNERMDQLIQATRQAAAEEAERTVMNAAQRISDQMAESILKNLGTQLASMGRSAAG